jgi:hypothetical protein
MPITLPSSNDIGTALERAARTLAVLIAATIAAYATTQSGVRAIATLIRKLTTHPLRTLIDLVPAPSPESLLAMLGAELLTDAEMAAEIAQYDASAKRKRAAASPRVRRKPAGARELVAVGA